MSKTLTPLDEMATTINSATKDAVLRALGTQIAITEDLVKLAQQVIDLGLYSEAGRITELLNYNRQLLNLLHERLTADE